MILPTCKIIHSVYDRITTNLKLKIRYELTMPNQLVIGIKMLKTLPSHAIIFSIIVVFAYSSFKLTPVVMNTLIDSSGSVYADLHKMLKENPSDKELFMMAKQSLEDDHLSANEYRDLIDLHFSNHGMFTANPISVNIPQSEMYPKSIHKPDLLNFINDQQK